MGLADYGYCDEKENRTPWIRFHLSRSASTSRPTRSTEVPAEVYSPWIAPRRSPVRARLAQARVNFTACFWGGILTTRQARPQRSSVQITQPPGSISRPRKPWNAEEGKAWWLLCQDSPKESHESHQTLRDSSRDENRCRPQ